MNAGLPTDQKSLEYMAGVTFEELKEDYRHRLFDRYLPFWERGAYDTERGGFMCYLNDDGSVADDEKPLWFQARAVFIYAMLFNDFGRDNQYLERAVRTRDFMVRHMRADNGLWYQRVHGDGKIKGDVYDDATGEWFYGWIYVAEGFAELYRATGDRHDLDMALESMHAALKAYDDPAYDGAWNYGGYPDNLSLRGARVQSHSMVVIALLTRLLSHFQDSSLEDIQAEHIDLVMNRFYNPELGIANENLHHDFSRLEGHEDYMQPGHSVETMWVVLLEAVRTGNAGLFNQAASRFRHYLELGWDYGFEGYGDMHFWLFDGLGRDRDTMYGVKSMWSHTELLIGLMHIYEYTGENWACEWYERVRTYALKAFDTDYGVWRQAVDRLGNDRKRETYSAKRKGNYHYPRYLMLNIMSIDRIIKNGGRTTPFPLKEDGRKM